MLLLRLCNEDQQRFACARRGTFSTSLNLVRRCFSSAHHAVRWTISLARLRWREARRLDCIDSLSRNSRPGWPSWNWLLATVLPPRLWDTSGWTRAAFEARSDDAIQYFSPVSQTPGFPKALAIRLLDLSLLLCPAVIWRGCRVAEVILPPCWIGLTSS